MAKETLIYGLRPVKEAVLAGQELERVFFKKGLQGEAYTEVLKVVRDNNIPFQFVPVEKLNRFTGKNHQGIIALVSRIPYQDIEEVVQQVFERGEDPLILVLDRITDVRNMGAIARTAACTGVHAILIPAKGSAQINEDAVKTSAGALNSIPVCRSFDLRESLKTLKKSGLKILYTSQDAEKFVFESDLQGLCAIILGSEEDGVGRELISVSDQGIKIPMTGAIKSLNVSVSAGIVLYEVLKQRMGRGEI